MAQHNYANSTCFLHHAAWSMLLSTSNYTVFRTKISWICPGFMTGNRQISGKTWHYNNNKLFLTSRSEFPHLSRFFRKNTWCWFMNIQNTVSDLFFLQSNVDNVEIQPLFLTPYSWMNSIICFSKQSKLQKVAHKHVK